MIFEFLLHKSFSQGIIQVFIALCFLFYYLKCKQKSFLIFFILGLSLGLQLVFKAFMNTFYKSLSIIDNNLFINVFLAIAILHLFLGIYLFSDSYKNKEKLHIVLGSLIILVALFEFSISYIHYFLF